MSLLDPKKLHQLAKENDYRMFTGEEICAICNISQNVVSRVRTYPDSPFFLNKCRPEWFLEWMRKHPEFQLTKADAFENHSLPKAFDPVIKPKKPRQSKGRPPQD